MGKGRFPLHTQIFIGLLVGAVAGIIATATVGTDNDQLKFFADNIARPVGQVFLRLIFMVVVPLLFAALVLGVAEIGDARRVGRIGLRSLAMTIVLSSLAVAVGLLLFNSFEPGRGISAERRADLMASIGQQEDAAEKIEATKEAKSVADSLLEVVSQNPVQDATRALEGGLLPLMFFALMFGLAMTAVPKEQSAPFRAFLEALFAITLKIIDFAMRVAPVAVAALMFFAITKLGIEAIVELGKYVFIVLAGLAFHQFVIYAAVLRLVARRNPWKFFSQIREIMMTAFATSSSNATLPTALRVAQEDAKLPKDISSFVLTVGATANQNGTALFEGITVLFLAQVFGVQLSFEQQLGVMGLAIVAGIGTAGVPGGAWPMIAIILMKFNVPPEAIGLVLGVDRVLDMSRTVLNVTGDVTIAACVTEMERRSTAKAAARA